MNYESGIFCLGSLGGLPMPHGGLKKLRPGLCLHENSSGHEFVAVVGFCFEYVVFTNDLDFGDILAATNADAPSVIQVEPGICILMHWGFRSCVYLISFVNNYCPVR
jgi:hypothetical protein